MPVDQLGSSNGRRCRTARAVAAARVVADARAIGWVGVQSRTPHAHGRVQPDAADGVYRHA